MSRNKDIIPFEFDAENFRSDFIRLRNPGGWQLDQAEKAELLKVSRATVMRIENGDRPPTIDEFMTVCNFIGFPPHVYFNQVREDR